MKQNIERIQKWSQQVGIYEHSTVQAQTLKAVSEMGEVADAIIKRDLAALEDGIGDVIVCLVNVAYMSGIDIEDAFAKVTDEVTARPDGGRWRFREGCEMTAHKHAALMAQYAQDWAETDMPWKRWEVAAPGDKFGSLFSHPTWIVEYEYRRKPRTLWISETSVLRG